MNKQGILDTLQQAINAVEDARPNAALDCLQQINALLDAPKGHVAIAFTMKTDDVPALLVALNIHACNFGTGVTHDRKRLNTMKEMKASKARARIIKVLEDDIANGNAKFVLLTSLKEDIKKQAGIK